jgi:hypothetical protein
LYETNDWYNKWIFRIWRFFLFLEEV